MGKAQKKQLNISRKLSHVFVVKPSAFLISFSLFFFIAFYEIPLIKLVYIFDSCTINSYYMVQEEAKEADRTENINANVFPQSWCAKFPFSSASNNKSAK